MISVLREIDIENNTPKFSITYHQEYDKNRKFSFYIKISILLFSFISLPSIGNRRRQEQLLLFNSRFNSIQDGKTTLFDFHTALLSRFCAS